MAAPASAENQARKNLDEFSTNQPYLIKRNYLSSLRLNFQHLIARGASGYLLHPSIPTNTSSGELRIADIGTGTGIWALEVAASLTTPTRIDCIDISGEQYPPPSVRPHNVQFHTHDCFKPFPAELHGQFDIVHIRFWVYILSDPDVKPILKNLTSLLKPNGYLQWFEPAVSQARVTSPDPALPRAASEASAAGWRKLRPDCTYAYIPEMPSLFSAEGMTEVVHSVHQIPDHLRTLWAQCYILGIEDSTQAVRDEKTRKGMEWLSSGLETEYNLGVFVDVPFQCVVGRKAA